MSLIHVALVYYITVPENWLQMPHVALATLRHSIVQLATHLQKKLKNISFQLRNVRCINQ